MAKFIDLGQKKADDPIFTEGIRFISIRKPKPSQGLCSNSPKLESAKEKPNCPCPDSSTPTKEPPHEPST